VLNTQGGLEKFLQAVAEFVHDGCESKADGFSLRLSIVSAQVQIPNLAKAALLG